MTDQMRQQVKDLALEGLMTDGDHHKQWYLEEIIKALGYSLEEQCQHLREEGYLWESGIAP